MAHLSPKVTDFLMVRGVYTGASSTCPHSFFGTELQLPVLKMVSLLWYTREKRMS